MLKPKSNKPPENLLPIFFPAFIVCCIIVCLCIVFNSEDEHQPQDESDFYNRCKFGLVYNWPTHKSVACIAYLLSRQE